MRILRRNIETIARNESSDDDLDDAELVGCVTTEFTKVVFPALDEVCPTLKIVYPLTFVPTE